MGALQDWIDQENNPAAPKGAQQAAKAGQGYSSGDPAYQNSAIGRWISDEQGGYTNNASAWYTGANTEDTSNGWDNGFREEAIKQYDQTLKEYAENPNAFNDWLNRRDATGVVTWGERRKEGDDSDEPMFGDVFNNGKRVANIYSDFKGPDADLMIADWMLDPKTKAKVFADPDRERWLGDEIESARQEQTDMLTRGKGAREFQTSVDEQQKELREGLGNEALIGGGSLLGGLLGAGVGTLIEPGGGTAVGFGIGATLFGGAAALNEDQITELASRAIVQSRMADEEFGSFQGFTTGLSGWAGVGMKLISPFSNTVEGIADAKYGRIGDQQEDFYAIDENGNRKASTFLQIADVAATVGDSLLQFSNPAGLAAYSVAMTGQIAGEVGTLASTGQTFDLRSGDFHEHEGFKENAAAWANVGIDAVQLGMARGITAAARDTRALFGAPREVETLRTPSMLSEAKASVQARLPRWAGGVREGEEAVTLGGSRYVVDKASGEAVYKGFSLASLAPSELTQRVAVSAKTRIKGVRQSPRAAEAELTGQRLKLEADDYYRSAVTLASGNGSRFATALLNGFGEGFEEAAQAMLEPISADANFNAQEVARSFFYGAAAGLGMGLGATIGNPDQSKKLYGRFLMKGLLSGDQMSEEQFRNLPLDQQKALAALDDADVEKTKAARDQLGKALSLKVMDSGAMGRYALTTGGASEFDKIAGKANPAQGSLLAIRPFFNGDVTDDQGNLDVNSAPSYTAEFSAWRATQEVRKNIEALNNHVASLQRSLTDLPAAEGLDEALLAERNLEESRLTEMLADAQAAIEHGLPFAQRLSDDFETLMATTDPEIADDLIDEMNDRLEAAYLMQPVDGVELEPTAARALRQAVSVLYGRDPNLEDGSFTELAPRINRAMTRDAMHGIISVHQSLIAAPNADHDGDNFRKRPDLLLDRKAHNRLRAGEQYLVYSQEDGNNTVSVKVAAPDADATMIDYVHRASTDPRDEVRDAANHHIDALMEIFWTRYSPVVDDNMALFGILESFRKDLLDGAPAARTIFLDALATRFASNIQEQVARYNGYAEWPWISQQITAKLDAVQRVYASTRPEYDYEPGELPGSATDSVQKAWIQQTFLAEAATNGETMQMVRAGGSDVRASQALHYSVYRALIEALDVKDTLAPELMQMLQRHQEGRSGGIVRSSLEDMLARNSTTARVYDDLQAALRESQVDLGPNSHHALLLLGMTKVQDFDFTDDGPVPVNRDITFAQYLLRRSVRIDRQTYAEQAERNEDVINRLDRLDALTRPRNNDGGHSTAAQEAMFEIVADVPLYQLLGDSAMFMGPSRTLRDLKLELSDLNRTSRLARFSTWQRKAPYFGRSERTNPPYSLSEVEGSNLHPYRVAVDLLEAVVNKAAPQRSERNERVFSQFETGWANLLGSLDDFASQLSAADRAEFDALPRSEQILEMVNTEPRLYRAAADMLTDAVKLGAFSRTDNDEVYAANWVVDMFGMEPAEAMMQYWRYTTLTDYIVSDPSNLEATADEITEQVEADLDAVKRGDNSARTYARLRTHSARLLYRVAATRNQVLLHTFLRELSEAKDLRRFQDEVLNDPRYLGNHAPITVFVDDVAESDQTFERRWQPSYPGAQQREAIRKFSEATTRYSEQIAAAKAVQASDTQIAAQIEAHLLSQQGLDVRVSDNGAYLANQLLRVVENAQTLWTSIGPTARDEATAAVQSGLLIRYNKGAADPALAPFGGARVLAEGGGTKTSIMRAVADVTAYHEDDVLSNPSLLAHRAMRIQLRNGAIVDWTLPETEGDAGKRGTALAFARMLKDPATAGFAKEVLGLSVRDKGPRDQLQTVTFRGGASMDLQPSLK